MIGHTTAVQGLRWLAVLLLSLLWATMGSAAALAERGGLGGCALPAKTPLGDLTAAEIKQIQGTVDAAGGPLDVVENKFPKTNFQEVKQISK